MSVEYRKNRKRWGYRFYLRGKCYSRYVWETKTEAKVAERVARTEAEKAPALQPTALTTASGAFLIASAERQRSTWRLLHLRATFKAYVIPFFGEATPITDITPKMVENFIIFLKQTGQRRFPDRKLKNKTIFNIITDLRAMFYWAMEEDIALCSRNPVTAKVSKMIGSTKSVKAPFNPRWFDIAAASIEDKRDRAWFDVTRYLGMRLDESNRLQWSDINWQAGKVRYPGTKTPEAQAWLPIAPVVLKTLRDLYDSGLRDLNSPYVFPGRSPTTKGKKVYSRRCIFERIQKATAIRKYMRQHPDVTRKQAVAACKKDGFAAGIKLTAKDLRDYFCTEVAAKSDDAAVAMRLMRHTSLTTTTKYMRTVEDRMRQAVENRGCDSGCDSMAAKSPEMLDLAKLEQMSELTKMLERYGFLNNKNSNLSDQKNLVHADDIHVEAFLGEITHPPDDLERHRTAGKIGKPDTDLRTGAC